MFDLKRSGICNKKFFSNFVTAVKHMLSSLFYTNNKLKDKDVVTRKIAEKYSTSGHNFQAMAQDHLLKRIQQTGHQWKAW